MTSHSSREANELKQRMEKVRCRMDRDMVGIVERSQELLDWRYYYRRFPWASLGLAVGAGFLAVPRRRSAPRLQLDDATWQELKELSRCSRGEMESDAPKSLLATALGIAGTMALRAALPLLAQRVGHFIGDHADDDGRERDGGE